MGEYYRLNVYVKTTKGNEFLVSSKGDLSKVPALTMLDEEAPQNMVGNSNTGFSRPGSNSRGSSSVEELPTFQKQHFKVELIEVRETSSGRYLECELRVTSEEKNTVVNLFPSGTKIFNQDNLTEHKATTVNISDVTVDRNWAAKQLISDTPVRSTITFEPNESIDVIAKLQIRFSVEGIGEIYVDFSDVFVKR